MKGEILKKIAIEYGTPSFVFNMTQLDKRITKIKNILGKKIKLCYSVKANPFLLKSLEEKVEKIEVCSPGELLICKRLNILGEKIIYSGVNKGREDIEEAIRYDSGIYTIESKLQLKLLNEGAKKYNKKILVLIRLTSGNQFGVSKDELYSMIENRKKYENLEIVGLHYFAGTQRKKLEEQKRELIILREIYREIFQRYNVKLNKLEYGPGLSVPLFESENFDDTLFPLKELSPFLLDIASELELTIEMGRFYVTEVGYYLSKVVDIKSNQSINYAILDGGMNHLNYIGQVMGMKIPKIDIYNEKQISLEKDWCICGSLCTSSDVIIRKLKTKKIHIGDIVIFYNVGAYSVTEGIYLFLSRMMPRILLYDEKNGVKIVREIYDTSILNTPNLR